MNMADLFSSLVVLEEQPLVQMMLSSRYRCTPLYALVLREPLELAEEERESEEKGKEVKRRGEEKRRED